MALKDKEIRAFRPLDKPYRKADSGGLYLEVFPNGTTFLSESAVRIRKDQRCQKLVTEPAPIAVRLNSLQLTVYDGIFDGIEIGRKVASCLLIGRSER